MNGIGILLDLALCGAFDLPPKPSVIAFPAPASTSNELVFALLIFGLLGAGFIFAVLNVGRLLRPARYHPEKMTSYECGEPTIGESWVQFDLRFYTVALIFIVFDVELALLWPWAVAFRNMPGAAFWPFFIFFMLIAIPFAYEWGSGYLDWVRASTGEPASAGSEGRDSKEAA